MSAWYALLGDDDEKFRRETYSSVCLFVILHRDPYIILGQSWLTILYSTMVHIGSAIRNIYIWSRTMHPCCDYYNSVILMKFLHIRLNHEVVLFGKHHDLPYGICFIEFIIWYHALSLRRFVTTKFVSSNIFKRVPVRRLSSVPQVNKNHTYVNACVFIISVKRWHLNCVRVICKSMIKLIIIINDLTKLRKNNL